MYALCVCKGLNVFNAFMCGSMYANIAKQYKLLVTHTKQGINTLAKAYKVMQVFMYALIALCVFGFT